MADTVAPRLFRGLRDLMPEQMQARQWMIDTIRAVYERYGFVPLGTPAIEYRDVLFGSAGAEAQSQTFGVHNPDCGPHTPDEDRLALRFDLTVPLARVVAQYADLPRPFRRYQVASVWRADKPDRGRFREFTQFDIDSVGVESEIADTEIITGMCDTLSALKVGPYQVRFSSRKVLNLLMPYAGIPPERAKDVFRVLDKLDKIGPKKLRLELTEGYVDKSGDPIPGLGLDNQQVDKIERFLAIRSDKREGVLSQLRELFSKTPGAAVEIDALARISGHLQALDYGDDQAVIDLSVARGLAYYTGPVFEAVLLDAPQFGSVFAGGRYDELVMRFLGERLPATGASIGVDRLLAALLELDRIPLRKATARVLVSTIDAEMMSEYVAMTYELRRASIPAEVYLGSGKRIGKQIKYADRYGIPITILYGSNEKAAGKVVLKDMAAGRAKAEHIGGREQWREERPGQIEVPRQELVSHVRELLVRIDAENRSEGG
ncbi:MAG: histidine--tRNA ligase [Planctomycetota bacterium]